MQTINLPVLHALHCAQTIKIYCNGPCLWPRLTSFVGSVQSIKPSIPSNERIKRLCVCETPWMYQEMAVIFSQVKGRWHSFIRNGGGEQDRESGFKKGKVYKGARGFCGGWTNILCVTRTNIFWRFSLAFLTQHFLFLFFIPFLSFFLALLTCWFTQQPIHAHTFHYSTKWSQRTQPNLLHPHANAPISSPISWQYFRIHLLSILCQMALCVVSWLMIWV